MARRGYRQCDNATKVHHSYTAAADNRAFVPFEFGDELYELVRVKKVQFTIAPMGSAAAFSPEVACWAPNCATTTKG